MPGKRLFSGILHVWKECSTQLIAVSVMVIGITTCECCWAFQEKIRCVNTVLVFWGPYATQYFKSWAPCHLVACAACNRPINHISLYDSYKDGGDVGLIQPFLIYLLGCKLPFSSPLFPVATTFRVIITWFYCWDLLRPEKGGTMVPSLPEKSWPASWLYRQQWFWLLAALENDLRFGPYPRKIKSESLDLRSSYWYFSKAPQVILLYNKIENHWQTVIWIALKISVLSAKGRKRFMAQYHSRILKFNIHTK